MQIMSAECACKVEVVVIMYAAKVQIANWHKRAAGGC